MLTEYKTSESLLVGYWIAQLADARDGNFDHISGENRANAFWSAGGD
jgi:hypothetical protein